jgi:5'-phosphate synthase pdxT subunit
MPIIGGEPVRAAVIRAPIIRSAESSTVIAALPNGDIVGVREGNCVGISFHPELIGENRVHEWWLNTVVAGAER